MVGLREQNKALRREAILDATLQLLGEHEPAEVTTEQIAAIANVSAATVFNLIGTREELLIALGGRVVHELLESLAELEEQTGGDPIGAARLIIDTTVAALTADSTAYRRVISEIAMRHDLDAYAGFDPARLQEDAMRAAQQRDIVDPRFDPAGLGKQIYASYSAAMLHWAIGKIDNAGFLVLARHGLVTVLAATATDAHRPSFRDELIAMSSELAALPRPT